MLKVNQSAEASCPEVRLLAVGRLMTRELVLVVMLKILPAVPVETLLITPDAMETVEVPEIEIPVPAVRSEPISEKLGAAEPLDLRTWKEVPPRVERKVEPS